MPASEALQGKLEQVRKEVRDKDAELESLRGQKLRVDSGYKILKEQNLALKGETTEMKDNLYASKVDYESLNTKLQKEVEELRRQVKAGAGVGKADGALKKLLDDRDVYIDRLEVELEEVRKALEEARKGVDASKMTPARDDGMGEKNKKLREALKGKVVELANQKKENAILLTKMEGIQMGFNADRKKAGE